MKAIKILFGLGGLLLLLAGGVFVYFMININQLVKDVVESEGPAITKTSVQLDSAGVQLFNSKAELNDFVIGNPEGFTSDYLLKWEKVLVDADAKSLNGDVIVLQEVVIQGVKINAEQKGFTSNLQQLLDNLNSDAADKPADDGGKPILLAVERLKFADNSINFITEKYGNYQLDLPPFDLSNLGSRSNGLSPEQLGKAILKPLVKQAQRAAENRLKDAAKEKLEGKLEDKKEELEAKVDEKKDELKDKLGDEAKNKLNKLLKRD